MVFLSQKVDGNMIFTDYWKVIVLTFSEMGNTVFSWAKNLTEIWYLLITGKFLFWTFRWWEIRSFFESRSWWKDDIYWLLTSSCFELFGNGKYGLFSAKKLMEKWYLLGLLSFPWYSRTWEIWFFTQYFHLRAKQTLCVCVIEASLKLFWRLCSRFPVCGPDI